MLILENPRLRPHLEAVPDESDPRYVYLWDPRQFSKQPQRLSRQEFSWIQLFDGQRTLREIQAVAMHQVGGELLPLDLFTSLIGRLDEAYYLESQRFLERVHGPVREPACLGCYASDPEMLRRQVRRLFTDARGPGLPNCARAGSRLRGALLPHIDYQRGGVSYAWGFKEVFEQTDASLFVIIATSHYSAQRFILTRKDFKTPLGITPTDQAYLDRLVAHYGPGLFDDEIAHLPEHSIELEVVFLQYLYEKYRPIRIVPLLVGSFQDAVQSGVPPRALDDVGRMIEALRRVEGESHEPICYIISGDLAHLGPKFGDAGSVGEDLLQRSQDQDQKLLRRAEAGDTSGYFRLIADEFDRRRICGLPPTYTTLEALKPRFGKTLHYDRYIHARGFESVSFASVAFYR
jgi:AmmeMemoRadiSam system protein B